MAWQAMATGGGLLAVVAFLIPWVGLRVRFPDLVRILRDFAGVSISPALESFLNGLGSGRGEVVLATFSGMDLAAGPTVQIPIWGAVQVLSPSPYLWLLPLVGLLLVPLSLFLKGRTAGIATGAAALIGLGVLIVGWRQLESLRPPLPLNTFLITTPEAGLWLEALAIGVALVGAVIGIFMADDSQRSLEGAGPGPYDEAPSFGRVPAGGDPDVL